MKEIEEVRGICKVVDGIGSPAATIKVIRNYDECSFNEELEAALKNGYKIIQPIEHFTCNNINANTMWHVAVVGKGSLPG